jgi:hypothetical protein
VQVDGALVQSPRSTRSTLRSASQARQRSTAGPFDFPRPHRFSLGYVLSGALHLNQAPHQSIIPPRCYLSLFTLTRPYLRKSASICGWSLSSGVFVSIRGPALR